MVDSEVSSFMRSGNEVDITDLDFLCEDDISMD